jgi:DNA-directed RNA polymerase
MQLAQLKHEIASDAQASAQRLAQLREDAAKGSADIPHAQRVISQFHSGVEEHIAAEMAVMTRGPGGKLKGWLRQIPGEVAALLAIRECIHAVSTPTLRNSNSAGASLQHLLVQLGSVYETEVRIREAEKVNPMYMMNVHDRNKNNNLRNRDRLKTVFDAAYTEIMKGALDSSLSTTERAQLGKYGVDACIEMGIIERVPHHIAGGVVRFKLTQEIADYLGTYKEADVLNVIDPSTGAMMCPPQDWTTAYDGGYLSPRRKTNRPLIHLGHTRKSERRRLIDEVFTAANMPMVFECANYLQSIPFEVHQPTFKAVHAVWESDADILGVPAKSQPHKPVFPFAEDWSSKTADMEQDGEELTAWKRQMVRWHETMHTWKSRTRAISGFLRMTATMPEKCYFPVFMDTRGRWYYRGQPNLQGQDAARASIHFAEKKPLGERGLFWLRVHIANSYGFDKERMAVRAQWTIDNWPRISAALDVPADHPDVWGSDAPWCMYSAAYELRAALLLDNPEEYKTGVVIHMDATCSGLQHFAAMLRDPVGGVYVNLNDVDVTDTSAKQDIYARVGATAEHSVRADINDDPTDEKSFMAKWWNAQGISRKMAKQPVMTYVYGATLRGCGAGVADYLEDIKVKVPEGSRTFDFTQYAGRKLFTGIASTVPAAAAGMQWLRSVAAQMPKGKRMEWKTPTGFVVQHDYQGSDEIRVRLRSCGVQVTMFHVPNDETVSLKMQNAISPNFVHALDASHLTLTALAMKKAGNSFVGIHDSFGTHPCDVDAMHKMIRHEFVEMYKNHNVLSDFLWDVGGVGEVPMRGTLDLSHVLDSEFFFS